MSPFRWPLPKHDIMLAKEYAARKPDKIDEWDSIALVLSSEFRTEDKPIVLTGRACKERLRRLLDKYKDDDKKSLRKSGSEEEFNELHQLLEDINAYQRDMEEQKAEEKSEKGNKKKKEAMDKRKGEQMRAAALKGMAKSKKGTKEITDSENESYSESDSESTTSSKETPKGGKRKKVQQRASKRSAIDMLTQKNNQKVDVKKEELALRRMELDFQKEKYAAEADERKTKLEMEMQERRAILSLLKDRL
ncbi:uncharacterized protein [Acropora muricata]|uniref:uncharacterized protein n=1 Tax=Acropora muricata TaxID=159855 RepID=UPI0034E39592